jgi:glucosylceramidase
VIAPGATAAHRVSRPTAAAQRVSRPTASAHRVSRPTASTHRESSLKPKAHHGSGPEAAVTLTTPDLRRALSPRPAVAFGRINPEVNTIDVSDATRYQTVTGFGAAMTDSSAWLLYDELPADARDLVMASLFAGIDLDYIRVPMGASDFSAGGVPYSYDDMPAGETDPTLADFSIAHDQAYIIPTLRQALELNPGVQVLAEPWSLPAWMKANDALDNEDYAGDLLTGDYQAGAGYFVRFIQSYDAAGVPISAITPTNEAHTSSLYPGMNLDEDGFITQNLVPALRAAGLNTEVYGLDGSGLPYAEGMLEDPAVRSAIAGIAWHCYTGLAQMTTLHALDPAAGLIMSECSPGIVAYTPAETVIASLRNYASAVDLWNLALDPNGGPKQPVAGCPDCGGLVTVDENTHEATLTQSFYEVGQVSKFVQRGAVRIASDRWVQDYSNPDGTYGVTPGLDNVALENPDGSKVLVATNNSETAIHFQVQWRDRAFGYTLAAGATVTFRWR